MVQQIYDQIKSPKNIQELNQSLIEIGLKWNITQIKLFLEMDANIVKSNELYRLKANLTDNSVILGIIDRVIGDKPIIPIKKIMEQIPGSINVTSDEILNIACRSGNYISPNGLTLKRIK